MTFFIHPSISNPDSYPSVPHPFIHSFLLQSNVQLLKSTPTMKGYHLPINITARGGWADILEVSFSLHACHSIHACALRYSLKSPRASIELSVLPMALMPGLAFQNPMELSVIHDYLYITAPKSFLAMPRQVSVFC